MNPFEEIPDFTKNLPEIDFPFEGVRGWLMSDGGQQTVFVEFLETIDVPEHVHSEQWEIPVSGQVDLKMDGETISRIPGQPFFIPSGKAHGALVHKGYKAIIVFNEPDRYKPKHK